MKTPKQEQLKWQAGVILTETIIGLKKVEKDLITGYSNKRLKLNLIKQRYDLSKVSREYINKDSFIKRK